MTAAVVVVNWNSGRWLVRCLESVWCQTRPPDQLVVVDNASTDGSLDAAKPVLRGAHVIRLDSNAGFARASNVGARAAGDVDFLALLNPDAFAEPDWLQALVAAAERSPGAAGFASQMRLAAAPRLLDGAGDSYNASGFAWRNGYRLPCDEWPAVDVEVFAPCAAAALYRRDAFEEAGGFDERFFCYLEDVELGFRLRLLGYRCLYVHSAVVYHIGSAATGYRSDFAVYHTERNVVWTYVKNMPGPLLWLYLTHHLGLNLAALLYYGLRGQGRAALRAKVDALRGLRETISARRSIQRRRKARPRVVRQAFGSLAFHPRFSSARRRRGCAEGWP